MIKKLSSTLSENKFFFIGWLLLLIIGGILLLNTEKGEVILFFNGHRTHPVNIFFRIVTQLGELIGYLIVMVFVGYHRWRSLWLVPMVGAIVMAGSKILKEIFQQSRPIAWFREQELFDSLIVVSGEPLLVGASSFPSGHSMSAFALYGLVAYLMPWKKGFGILMLLMATLIALSRVYLIHHFYMDIYAGAIVGTMIGISVYLVGTLPRFSSDPELKP